MSFTATNLHNIGHDYFEERQAASGEQRLELLRQAIKAFREGVRFCADQVEKSDRLDRAAFPFGINERFLCRAYRNQPKLLRDQHLRAEARNEAIAWGKKAVGDQDPSHYQSGWDLHEAQRELGIAFFDLESSDEAIQADKNARETLLLLRQRHGGVISRMALIHETIAVDDFNLINVLTSNEAANEKLIRELVDEAYAICEKLDVVRPLSRNLRQVYAYCSLAKAISTPDATGLPDVDLNRKAARLYSELVIENPAELATRGNLFLIRLQLADALAARSRDDESRMNENDGLTVANGYPDLFFQAGYNYAVATQEADKGSNALDSATRDRLRQRCARRVVQLLRAAVAAGFKNAARLRDDPVFASFQSDPEFRAITQDIAFPSNPFTPR